MGVGEYKGYLLVDGNDDGVFDLNNTEDFVKDLDSGQILTASQVRAENPDFPDRFYFLNSNNHWIGDPSFQSPNGVTMGFLATPPAPTTTRSPSLTRGLGWAAAAGLVVWIGTKIFTSPEDEELEVTPGVRVVPEHEYLIVMASAGEGDETEVEPTDAGGDEEVVEPIGDDDDAPEETPSAERAVELLIEAIALDRNLAYVFENHPIPAVAAAAEAAKEPLNKLAFEMMLERPAVPPEQIREAAGKLVEAADILEALGEDDQALALLERANQSQQTTDLLMRLRRMYQERGRTLDAVNITNILATHDPMVFMEERLEQVNAMYDRSLTAQEDDVAAMLREAAIDFYVRLIAYARSLFEDIDEPYNLLIAALNERGLYDIESLAHESRAEGFEATGFDDDGVLQVESLFEAIRAAHQAGQSERVLALMEQARQLMEPDSFFDYSGHYDDSALAVVRNLLSEWGSDHPDLLMIAMQQWQSVKLIFESE